jgi:hypothetical protein
MGSEDIAITGSLRRGPGRRFGGIDRPGLGVLAL